MLYAFPNNSSPTQQIVSGDKWDQHGSSNKAPPPSTNPRRDDFQFNQPSDRLQQGAQMMRTGMFKAEQQDAKEQPSSLHPPSKFPECKLNQSHQHFSGNLFSLDPNVGVAVNLAMRNTSSNNNTAGQEHWQPYRQYRGQLKASQDRPTLLRNFSQGDMSFCAPPMRLQVSNAVTSAESTMALVETEVPSSPMNSNCDTKFSSSPLKKSHSTFQKLAVETNTPHPSLEFPPLYFVLKKWPWLLEAVKSLYLYRWRASYPLQWRVPCSRVLRKMGIYLTWGELLLIWPFFGLVAIGTLWSFLYPSPSITGQVSRLPLIFCFATAMHNSFLSLLLGLPFLKAIWYHKLAGRIAFVNGVLHTYVCFYYPNDDLSIDAPPSGNYANVNFAPYLVYDRENISGTAILALVTGIVITSIPFIRHRFFEVFYYFHIVFAASMAGCAFFHSGKLVPILVSATWGFDLIVRKLIMAATRYPKKAQTRVISSSVVELRFPKSPGFDFNPGQYIYLCVPELSLLEWHPFSISSSPGQKMVTVHIRKAGSWTSALHNLAQTREEVSILLEGPYGGCDVDLTSERYSTVLLLSGGIGITPMQSICNQLIHEHSTGSRSLRTLSFVWIERDPMVMSEVEVVRRSSTLHLNTWDGDAMSVISRIDQSAPLDIASTILALVPPVATTDDEFNEVYPEIFEDERQEDFSVACIRHDPEAMCAMSQLTDERGYMESALSTPTKDEMIKDDDTFLGAAYASRAPTDVLDMQIYLTSTASDSGLNDLPFVYHGRPDINRLLLKMREEAIAAGERRIAVCVCAPARLVSICQKACTKFSDSRVSFDFHAEAFG